MGFLNLKWVACLNFIAAADFCPKISVLQLLLKIYGATWHQSKYILSLLCKLGFCGTYTLHPYALCGNSCPSKGRQPLDCAFRPEMWKTRAASQWLMAVWFFVVCPYLPSNFLGKGRSLLRCCTYLFPSSSLLYCASYWGFVRCFLCVPHNLGFPLVCWRTASDYLSLLKA